MVRAILVIGYGNELRGDDALGPQLACAIEQLRLPGVTVMRRHQLTPELADPISRADDVVFLDASLEVAGGVQVRPLDGEFPGQFTAHASHPSALLAMTRALYGSAPRGWWITMPAFDLGLGESLSARAQIALSAGLVAFKELWENSSDADYAINPPGAAKP